MLDDEDVNHESASEDAGALPPQVRVPEISPPKSLTERRAARTTALVATAAILLGGAVGVAIGRSTVDPTTTGEYRSLSGELDAAAQDRDDAVGQVKEARAAEASASASYDELMGTIDDRRADLDQTAARQQEQAAQLKSREAAVAAREAAVTATEQQVKASTITEGTWTVGVDIAPGTYRTTDAVSDCYWAIYRSGTNADSIIANDIVTGGRPTVTLKEGQDFRTERCGSWLKQ